MSTTTSEVATKPTPKTVSPIGAHVDASAAIFRWIAPGAERCALQISSETSFRDTAVDVEVERADTVTLYELLPSSGRKMYWRVRAFRAGEWSAWSDPASFVASDRNEADAAARPAPVRKAAAPQSSVPEYVPPPTVPVTILGTVDGHTPVGFAFVFLLALNLSFVLLMMLLRAVVLG